MVESAFVRHIACEACGSSDANALYDDGHTTCFSCGAYARGSGGVAIRARRPMNSDFLDGSYQPILKRALEVETCRKFGYRVATNRAGEAVQVADYRDAEGNLVAQKVRGRDKTFTIIGSGRDMGLFGQHLWPSKGRRVVVTEGEIDALSVAQACGLGWPVVSLPNGANGAKKAIQKALEWLCGYETVVLCFDMDKPGREAAAECAQLFPPGKCAVAELPRKDANEMLVAGEVQALSKALWNARIYRPDGICSLDEIEDRVLADLEMGRSYPWPTVNSLTYGRRLGEVIGLGGGSGCGKTDVFTQMIAHDVMTLGVTVGVIYLEQPVGETGRRIAGKLAGKRYHVPNAGWSKEDLEATWDALKATNRLFLYDSFGAMDWETIRSKIRYMVVSLGCQHIYLDHLTALAAASEDERKALEAIMAEVAGLAQELRCIIHYVSHLATPEGKPHEEGGRVMARHFKGSRAIVFWSHVLWGLERDTQDPGSPTVLRCLKERLAGQGTGRTVGLAYDAETGLLHECELHESADKHGFRDETSGNPDF